MAWVTCRTGLSAAALSSPVRRNLVRYLSVLGFKFDGGMVVARPRSFEVVGSFVLEADVY
jgi:hypothetical protein